MTALTLAQGSTIVDKALEKGRELKLQPLTVVVLDAGGQLKAMKREELVNSEDSAMIGTTGSAPIRGTSTSGISAPVP